MLPLRTKSSKKNGTHQYLTLPAIDAVRTQGGEIRIAIDALATRSGEVRTAIDALATILARKGRW